MTQKELLYVEDAIEHEKSIIKICQEALNNIDEEFKSFFNDEIRIHQENENRLLTLLGEKANG